MEKAGEEVFLPKNTVRFGDSFDLRKWRNVFLFRELRFVCCIGRG